MHMFVCFFNEFQVVRLQNVRYKLKIQNKVFQQISIQIFSLTQLYNFDILATFRFLSGPSSSIV